MKIRSKNKPTKIELKLVKQATKWYAEKLMTKRLTSKIAINLIFTSGLQKNTGCLAFCVWDDDNIRPRSFEIEIDQKLSKNEMLKALAHEMVHVKQYATGQMRDLVKNNNTKWEGKPHRFTNNVTTEEYWFSPWEIEAYGKEVGLFVMFVQHLKEEEGKSLKRK